MTLDERDKAILVQQINRLEAQLGEAKSRLDSNLGLTSAERNGVQHSLSLTVAAPANFHALLLISDSALPLGSFAFSSGLESFLAHRPKNQHNSTTFQHFLDISLHALACTTLPYVFAALRKPESLEEVDNDLDASISCTVARRASVAQGRALIGIWERSFRTHVTERTSAHTSLDHFIGLAKENVNTNDAFEGMIGGTGHLPPLFGAVSAALQIPEEHALYVYLLNHAKTLLSAAVRASIFGPYQAQALLISRRLRNKIWDLVEEELKHPRTTAEAGQSIPMLDLWGGRHEIIYSRIFNS